MRSSDREARIEDLAPFGDREIAGILDQVALTLHERRVQPRRRPARDIDGRTLALLVPSWVNESIGSPLSTARCRELHVVQAHFLAFVHVHDALLDGDAGFRRQRVADVAPLLLEAQRRLAKLFAPADPFWDELGRLVREQAQSARWELTARPPGRIDARLLRRLSQKLALFRWPAFAVPRLAGRPRTIPMLERTLDAFYLVLQLLDDLHDFREDANRGQINAVLAASGGATASGAEFASGVLRVCQAAQARLDWIEAHVSRGSAFQRACAYLSSCVQKTAAPVLRSERVRLFARALRRVAAGNRVPSARRPESGTHPESA